MSSRHERPVADAPFTVTVVPLYTRSAESASDHGFHSHPVSFNYAPTLGGSRSDLRYPTRNLMPQNQRKIGVLDITVKKVHIGVAYACSFHLKERIILVGFGDRKLAYRDAVMIFQHGAPGFLLYHG